jgi:hypothetical protein
MQKLLSQSQFKSWMRVGSRKVQKNALAMPAMEPDTLADRCEGGSRGGGARGPLWRQIQADVYGQPVELRAAEEGRDAGGLRALPADVSCVEVVAVIQGVSLADSS